MTVFYFFALALSICGYGFFVLFKLSVSRASLSVVERFQEEGVWGSRLALRILTNADRHILAAHIGRFLCTLGSGVWLLLISKSWLSVVSAEGVTSVHGLSSLGFFVLFALFITFVTVLFAQVLGAVGMQSPEKVLLSLGWLGEAFSALLRPLQLPIQLMLQFVERSGQIDSIPSAREITLSAEDLESVIEHSTQAGALDDSESELLYGALRLSEIRACEIMTPRADIVSIDADTSLEELRQILPEAGFSRVLVTGDHLDDVRGMLLAKDLMSLIGCEVENFSVVPYIRQVVFVDGELRGDDVLKRLRTSQAHLAVVLDEHGGVDGILTLEDLLEEIVGDIFDETDIREEEQEITVTTSGELLVDGGTSLADLESEHGVVLPEGEYDTIAGFIIGQLGRIPVVGEELRCNGALISVESVDENRVTQLRISLSKDAA